MDEQSSHKGRDEYIVWIYWHVNNTQTQVIRKLYERNNNQGPLRSQAYVKDMKKKLRIRFGALPSQVEFGGLRIERGDIVPEDVTRGFVNWLEANNVPRPKLAVGPLLPVPAPGDHFEFGQRRPSELFRPKARKGSEAARALEAEKGARERQQEQERTVTVLENSSVQSTAPRAQPQVAPAQPAAPTQLSQPQSTESTLLNTETADPRVRMLEGLNFEQRLEKQLEQHIARLQEELRADRERLDQEAKELKERIERETRELRERERQHMAQVREEQREQFLAESRQLRERWEREAQEENDRIAQQYREQHERAERERQEERTRAELEQRERAAYVAHTMKEMAKEQERLERERQEERDRDRAAREAEEAARQRLEQDRHKRELEQDLARRKRELEQQELTTYLRSELEAERKQREKIEQRLRDLERTAPNVAPVVLAAVRQTQTQAEPQPQVQPQEAPSAPSAPSPPSLLAENKRSLPDEFNDSKVNSKRRRESEPPVYTLEWLQTDRKRLVEAKASVYQLQAYDIAIGAVQKFGPGGYSHPLAREAFRQLVAYAPEVSVMIVED